GLVDDVEGGRAVFYTGSGRQVAQQAAHRRRAGRRGRLVPPDGVRAEVVGLVLDDAALAEPIPPRFAGPALLGRDDDDAVGRVGAIERCPRRPFDDLDILDV